MDILDYFRCRYLKQNVHTKRHTSLSTYYTGPYFYASLSTVCARSRQLCPRPLHWHIVQLAHFRHVSPRGNIISLQDRDLFCFCVYEMWFCCSFAPLALAQYTTRPKQDESYSNDATDRSYRYLRAYGQTRIRALGWRGRRSCAGARLAGSGR